MFKSPVARLALCAFVALVPTLALSQHYTQTNLVANVTGQAANTDPNLQNPWGLSAGYNPLPKNGPGHWWVSDENNGDSTLYDGLGVQNGTFIIPPSPCKTGATKGSPTGQVFSGSTTDFLIPQEATPAPARFIFATLDGTISAWNPTVPNAGNLTAEVEICSAGASYTGITTIVNGGKTFLLAADFKGGRIDCFDSTFSPCSTALTAGGVTAEGVTPAPDGTFATGAFTDTTFAADNGTTVVPFNVQAVGRLVYVTFVEKNATGGLVVGANTGFVNAYTVHGQIVRRYGKIFNAPWGVAQSGVFFGDFSHALLIANHGDGTVTAIEPGNGTVLGSLVNASGAKLSIPGLFGIAFGNDGDVQGQPGSGPAISLYFTANKTNGLLTSANGLFGTITPVPNELAGAQIF